MTWSIAERCARRPCFGLPVALAVTLTVAVAVGLLLPGTVAASPLAHEEAMLSAADPKDHTLHRLQAGVHALRENRRDRAALHFDAALASIESVFSNAEGAAKARSLWYEEGAKDFKGEPYERAMAYYYRGLLYLAEADYENARASFRTGLMQSAFAEEQQYRSGFATMMFLEGWANQLLQDARADEAYAEARQYRPTLARPAPDANTLVIVELAGSPRKLGDGIGNHEIVYRPARRTPEVQAELALGGRPLPALFTIEDLFHQATHRGERAIDRIIDGKVSFQTTTGSVGSALGTLAAEGAVINAGLGGSAGAALGGLAAVGAIASLVSAQVKPRADVRYWANLPTWLQVATARLDADVDITVRLFDAAGRPVSSDAVVAHHWTNRLGHRLVWVKTRP